MRRLSQEEVVRELNDEMGEGMRKLLSYDLVPYSVVFALAKSVVIRDIGKKHPEYRLDTKFRFDKEFLKKEYRIMIPAWFLHKIPLFRNMRVIIFIDRFLKIPQMIRKKWYLKMDGHKLVMNYHDKSMKEIFNDYIAVKRGVGVWEPQTTKIVKAKVKSGDVCIDVGASVGYFTLLFSRLVGPKGRVFAFEPTPNQIPYLLENIRKNGYKDRVTVHAVGAWDKTGTVQLPVNASVQYPVKCVALDDVMDEENVEAVNFIKIDVDGPDTKVLKGLVKTFERSPNLKMVVEYYPQYIKDAGDDPKEFVSILKKYFTCSKIPGDYEDGCWNLYCEKKPLK